VIGGATARPALPRLRRGGSNAVLGTLAAALAGIGAGLGLAVSPYLVMGGVVGAALMVFALVQPLTLVTVMLVLGPADLSIITGGFKGMFAHLGGLDMNGIRLIAMTAALALVILVERPAGRQAFRPTAVFYVALLGYGALTLLFTPSFIDGARLLLKIGYPLIVFLVIAGLATSRMTLDRLMDAVLIGTVVLCVVINPLYLAFGEFEREIGGWIRLRGVGTHQNPFAFYLLAALLMSVVRFITRRQTRYLVLSAICSFWMVLTIARIAFAATLVSLLAVGIVGAVITRQTRMLIGTLVVAVLIAIPFAPPVLERTLGFVPGPGELVTMLSDPRALYSAINWEGRQMFWIVVFDAFRSSPVFGLGLGASSFILAVQFPIFQNPVVHNDYLRLLSDTGLIGVLLFTLALGAWLLVAVRGARIADRTVREYALPAVGCIAALAIIGITDNAFDYYGPFTQYVGFLCGGVVAGAACYQRELSAQQDPAPGGVTLSHHGGTQ
jgi:O-antigen ligase